MPDDQNRRRAAWALWRYGVLGPLVSARLEHGDRIAYLREAAAREHVDPDGNHVVLSATTSRHIRDAYWRWCIIPLRRKSSMIPALGSVCEGLKACQH